MISYRWKEAHASDNIPPLITAGSPSCELIIAVKSIPP